MRHKVLAGIIGVAAGIALVIGAQLSTAGATQLSDDVEQELNQLRDNLVNVKGQMASAMNCCLETACNFCPLAAGKCPCGNNLTTDTGVCGECYLGWHAGHGRFPGVDVSKIQMIEGDMLKMMYDAHAEHFGE